MATRSYDENQVLIAGNNEYIEEVYVTHTGTETWTPGWVVMVDPSDLDETVEWDGTTTDVNAPSTDIVTHPTRPTGILLDSVEVSTTKTLVRVARRGAFRAAQICVAGATRASKAQVNCLRLNGFMINGSQTA